MLKYLIHPSLRDEHHPNYRSGIVAVYAMVLIFAFFNFYTIYFLLNYPLNHHQNVNNLGGYVMFVIFFIVLRLSSQLRYILMFITLGSLPLMYNSIYNTGGLYSSDIIWMLLITITSTIFMGSKFGILMMTIGLSYFSWLYYKVLQNKDFFLEYINNDHSGHYFFTWSFVLILTTTILVAFSKKMEKTNQLIDEIKAKKIQDLEREVLKVTTEISKLRTEIAKDFHDEMGNKLVSIHVMTEILQNKVKQDDFSLEEVLTISKQVQEKSKEVYQGTKDFIWTIDWKNDAVLELFYYIAEFAESFLTIQEITVNTISNLSKANDARINPMTSRQIIFICKEILTNAAKHSNCTEVSICFELQNHQLKIQISDNGKGIDTTQKFKRGVKNVMDRAKKIEATCTLNSLPTYQGTEYTIELLLH